MNQPTGLTPELTLDQAKKLINHWYQKAITAEQELETFRLDASRFTRLLKVMKRKEFQDLMLIIEIENWTLDDLRMYIDNDVTIQDILKEFPKES
jgi:hypothetical protein